MITERKAIQEIFDDLQRERKELKANYREDLANLEKRQDDLLTRLERLDGIEREAIDPEGLLNKMAETMDKMAEYIPSIPAGDVLDATAEKLAAAAASQGENAPIIYSEITPKKVNQSNKKPSILDYATASLQGSRPGSIDTIIDCIEAILIEKGRLTSGQIADELKSRFGWEWGSFGQSFSGWRMKPKYRDRITKKGLYYAAALAERGQENGQTDESAPETTA